MMETIAEKQRKYCELQQEIKRMWEVEDVNVVPFVISTIGVIPKCLHKNIKRLKLSSTSFILMQKAVIVNILRIVRKFIN